MRKEEIKETRKYRVYLAGTMMTMFTLVGISGGIYQINQISPADYPIIKQTETTEHLDSEYLRKMREETHNINLH